MKGGKGVNVSGMDDLDKALEAEMKAQVEKTQVRIFNIFKIAIAVFSLFEWINDTYKNNSAITFCKLIINYLNYY